MLHKIFRKIAPVAALAMGFAASGCDNMNVNFSNSDGVPLSQLDMSGAAPTELVLAGPDTINVTDGDRLAITVEGNNDVTDALRFDLDGDTLTVTRENDSDVKGTATVNVTMPAIASITSAGSGTINAQSLAENAEVTIAGSGEVTTGAISVKDLDVTIAGSGSFSANGSAENLDLTVAGSGSARMSALKVGKADINIAGSGDANFASDGTVEANIMGSGTVSVTGSANCTISSMGSGTLNCSAGTTKAANKPNVPDAPEPPAAPDAPADES